MRQQKQQKAKNNQIHSVIVYFLFLFIFYFFLMKYPLEEKIRLFSYTDELLALCAVPLFLYTVWKTKKFPLPEKRGYARYIICFLLTGLAGNLAFHYQPFFRAAIPDFLLCAKFWLGIYVGKKGFEKLSLSRYAGRLYFHIRVVIWTYVSLILADYLTALLRHGQGLFKSEIRYGLRSTHLFYSHPTLFAACCVFLFVILISIRPYIDGSRKYMLILGFLLCSTLRSKALGTVIVWALVYYLVSFRHQILRLRTFLIFIPVLIGIGWNQIYYYFFSKIQSDSARYHMLITSIRIANDHFPLGAGLGTFASYLSGSLYSPLYEKYGISGVWGLREGEPFFVSDTYWPMILGQTGWIGLIFMLLAIWMLFCRIQRLYFLEADLYLSGLFVLLYLLVSSAAESAFVHPSAMPLALWIGILMRREIHEEPTTNQRHCTCIQSRTLPESMHKEYCESKLAGTGNSSN